MSHDLLSSVLDAQRANATLQGAELRVAAEGLARLSRSGRTLLMAFDSAGERIIGAAMALSAVNVEVFDYTSAFPADASCLLVGGHVAGPVGAAAAAAAVVEAGAARVEVAMLGGWSQPIEGIARVWRLGAVSAQVA
jgi:hypothetical protein